MAKQKSIVAFGGGSVVPELILEPFAKNKNYAVAGVTSMVDNGGSTGQLRRDFGVLPPGDIRRHLLALSQASQWKKDLMKFRFGHEVFGDGHVGHSFANVLIGGVEHVTGDFKKTLAFMHEFLEVPKRHRALPQTIDSVQLVARLSDGSKIEGEDEIDSPQHHSRKLSIMSVHLKPKARLFPETKKRITEADTLIFGPGDLYSSIIASTLADGMKQLIAKSKAKKILVIPSLEKKGESHGFSVERFTAEVERYIGCEFSHVIYNTGRTTMLKKYLSKHPEFGTYITPEGVLSEKFLGVKLFGENDDPLYSLSRLHKVLDKLL